MPIGTSEGEIFKSEAELTIALSQQNSPPTAAITVNKLPDSPAVEGPSEPVGASPIDLNEVPATPTKVEKEKYQFPWVEEGNRTVSDKLTGKDGKERYITWPEKAVRGILGNIETFNKAARGEIDVKDPMVTDAVAGLSLDLGLTGLATAGFKPGVGLFGGRFSREAVEQAKRMEGDGFSPMTVKELTGLERGADNMWRMEMDDSKATIDESKLRPLDPKTGSSAYTDLGSYLKHDEFFKAYPEAKDVPVIISKNPMGNSNWEGAFTSGDSLNPHGLIFIKEGMSKDKIREVLLHEVQHFIQRREGFSIFSDDAVPKDYLNQLRLKISKSSPAVEKEVKEMYKGVLTLLDFGDKEAAQQLAKKIMESLDYELYRRYAHEVEAFNVSRRMDMSARERKLILGKSTEDRPREVQIVGPTSP